MEAVEILKIAFWTFVLVLALSFFGISIQSIVNSAVGQQNFAYIGSLLASLWSWIVIHIQLLLQVLGLGR